MGRQRELTLTLKAPVETRYLICVGLPISTRNAMRALILYEFTMDFLRWAQSSSSFDVNPFE